MIYSENRAMNLIGQRQQDSREEDVLNFDLSNHKPLREVVYEDLKQLILTGKIAPGTRMMEVELAEHMGVSRTPVREALRKLEKENLVVIEPRKGAYVTDVSVKDMLDILEVREELEGFAASLAASRTDENHLSELLTITARYSEAVKANDTEKMIFYDEMFHKYVVTCSGNKTLIQLSETVQELALRFRYLYYDDFTRYENMPFEHKQMIEAIKSGDSEAAKKVARAHVNELKKFVKSRENDAFGNNESGKTGECCQA